MLYIDKIFIFLKYNSRKSHPFFKRKPLMKLKLIIIAIVVLGLSACTQKTCPTYAKEDVKQEKTVAEADA